jgi:putative ABC transport system permease protein
VSNPLNRTLLADRRSLRSPIGLRPSMLMFLYLRRLRAHLVQELLAGTGIAIGVALVFGVLLANTGLTSSTERLIRGLSGSARLTLVARSAAGFSESLASQVRTLPGVQVSTSVLRENVTVEGPAGRQALQLIGVSPSLATLGGISQQELGNGALLLSGGLGLPSGVATTVGAQRGERVTVMVNGVRHRLNVGAIITSESVKALAGSPVVVALLSVAQKLAGRPERVTQTLVVPAPGREAQVANELRTLARGRLDVEPVDHELSLLHQATVPNRQSTSLFSAISVMVGFLLALNAMLLTVPERRRFIAELRMQGYDPRQIVLLLAFQAVVLGLAASVIGVVLGYVLAHNLYSQGPSYLVVAFPITAEQSLGLAMALLAVASGVLATLLASLSPVLDLRPGLTADAAFREAGPAGGVLTSGVSRWCGLLGLALIALVGGLVLAFPSLTILGGVALALASILLVPPLLAALAHWSPRLIAGSRSGAAIVAASELRAISTRSVALGAIVALAVYGSVAIGGARDDLLHGIEVAVAQYENTADIWVTQGRNVFNTDDFVVGHLVRRVAHAPGVLSVRIYRGGLSDVGSRRMWVRARVSSDPTVLESSQLLQGDFARAQGLIRSGGWAAVSIDFADERHLHLGSMFDFPTPSGPAPLRVAAITTNGGWPAGAITLGGAEYARWWGGGEATALEVTLRAGVSPQTGARAVREALGPAALVVKTSAQSAAEADTSARQGLSTLSEISTMLLIVAALSVAAALSTTLWQRRARLASLKIQGYHSAQLWLGLLLESAAMLVLGSLVGAGVGIYGHALAGGWLTISTGFPAPFALGISHVLLTLALITIIASAVVSLAGLAAARVPPWVSLQE